MSVGYALDIVSWVCLIAGSFFAITGGIGIVRLPDFFSRMHAGGLTDTMGTTFLLVGLALQSGWSLVSVKLMMILLFILVTSPTAAHALAKAARSYGLEPWERPSEESSSNL